MLLKPTCFVKVFYASCLLLISLSLFSCKKGDFTAKDQAPEQEPKKPFFHAHKPENPITKQLFDYFLRLNEKTGIAEKIAYKYGIPYWNKTLLHQSKNARINGRGSAANDVLVAYIPLLHDSDTTVRAQLTVRATATDTSFEVLTSAQYKRFGFQPSETSDLNALKVFTLFANHDKNVFGYTRFKILDNRILKCQTAFSVNMQKQYVLELYSTTSTPSGKMMSLAAPNPSSSCLMVYDLQGAGYTVDYYKIGETCVITMYGFGDDLSGGTGDGTTGSGGDDTGGGSNPCDSNIPLAGKVAPCDDIGGDGWEPQPLEEEPQQEDPCTTAKNIARKMDSLFTKSKADSVLAAIPDLFTEKNEKGFPIIKKLKINPYDVTDTSLVGYHSGDVHTGTTSSINYEFTLKVMEFQAGAVHTHPRDGYSAHSAFDIYNLIEKSAESPHYEGSFVAAANGSQYVITITDATKANAFLSTKSQYLDSTKWKEDSEIGKAFDKAKNNFEDRYKGNPNAKNLAYEMAMAAVLNQYNAGVTLNKKDASGNFKPIVVKASPDPKKPKKTIYTQDCL